MTGVSIKDDRRVMCKSAQVQVEVLNAILFRPELHEAVKIRRLK